MAVVILAWAIHVIAHIPAKNSVIDINARIKQKIELEDEIFELKKQFNESESLETRDQLQLKLLNLAIKLKTIKVLE